MSPYLHVGLLHYHFSFIDNIAWNSMVSFRAILDPGPYFRHVEHTVIKLQQQRVIRQRFMRVLCFTFGKNIAETEECDISISQLEDKTINKSNNNFG